MNANELKVLKAMMDNSLNNGGDFGFSDEVVAEGVEGLSKNQVKGYLSALQKKGMIYINSESNWEAGDCQTEFDKEPLEELMKEGIIDKEYCEQFDCWYRNY